MTEAISTELARKLIFKSAGMAMWLWRHFLESWFYKFKRFLRPQPRNFIFFKPVLGLKIPTSWGEISEFIRKVICLLSKEGVDVVVGTGVGGGILAALIAGNYPQDITYYAFDREVTWKARNRNISLNGIMKFSEMRTRLKGKRVLVVAAELVSGQTTRILKETLIAINPESIQILCIDYHSLSDVHPDYYYNKIYNNDEKKANIIQKPWRIVKFYKSGDEAQRPS